MAWGYPWTLDPQGAFLHKCSLLFPKRVGGVLLLRIDAKTQPLSSGAKLHLRDRVLGEAENKSKRGHRASIALPTE